MLTLWLAVRTQWRAGGVGLVGLDYIAVQHEADRLGIDLLPPAMDKIRALEAHELRRQQEGRAKQAEAAVKQGTIA